MSTPATPLLHLALRLDGERCLVVGGGAVAAHKSAALLECGAVVTVVAPALSEAVRALPVRLVERPVEWADLDGCRLVVTATGEPEVDRAVFAAARERGVLVNAADFPEACDVLWPAVVRSGPISVAVSTGGVSPFLAGWVKRRVAAVLDPPVAALAELVGETRRALRAAGRSSEEADWSRLVDDALWPLLTAGEEEAARAAAAAWLAAELGSRPGS